MATPRVIQPKAPMKGVQSWIEANNQLIYTLVTSETPEAQAIDVNTRLKLITQLKLRNKELRLLRINRITDKLMDKIEAGVENLMATDISDDIQFIPMYLQILKSLQESAKAASCEVEFGDALIFDTIEEVSQTGLAESSRDKIRTAAKELLALCTTTSDSSETTSPTTN